jgi:hypothetical protein
MIGLPVSEPRAGLPGIGMSGGLTSLRLENRSGTISALEIEALWKGV